MFVRFLVRIGRCVRRIYSQTGSGSELFMNSGSNSKLFIKPDPLQSFCQKTGSEFFQNWIRTFFYGINSKSYIKRDPLQSFCQKPDSNPSILELDPYVFLWNQFKVFYKTRSVLEPLSKNRIRIRVFRTGSGRFFHGINSKTFIKRDPYQSFYLKPDPS